jgi:hypothetical protein
VGPVGLQPLSTPVMELSTAKARPPAGRRSTASAPAHPPAVDGDHKVVRPPTAAAVWHWHDTPPSSSESRRLGPDQAMTHGTTSRCRLCRFLTLGHAPILLRAQPESVRDPAATGLASNQALAGGFRRVRSQCVRSVEFPFATERKVDRHGHDQIKAPAAGSDTTARRPCLPTGRAEKKNVSVLFNPLGRGQQHHSRPLSFLSFFTAGRDWRVRPSFSRAPAVDRRRTARAPRSSGGGCVCRSGRRGARVIRSRERS